MMTSNDFIAFSCLMNEVCRKAFGEMPQDITSRKAKALSNFIYESTGSSLSYKSLDNYIRAVNQGQPLSVNPSDATLTILVLYLKDPAATNQQARVDNLIWYRYRSEKLGHQA